MRCFCISRRFASLVAVLDPSPGRRSLCGWRSHHLLSSANSLLYRSMLHLHVAVAAHLRPLLFVRAPRRSPNRLTLPCPLPLPPPDMQAFYHKNVVAYQQAGGPSNRSSAAPVLDLEWEHQFDVGAASSMPDAASQSGRNSMVRRGSGTCPGACAFTFQCWRRCLARDAAHNTTHPLSLPCPGAGTGGAD